MRLALPGSALVHAGAVSLLFVGFVWPQAEDAAAPAPVTVNIVPTTNVTSNASEVLEADNSVSAVSSGSVEALEPITETIEPETAEPVEPVAPDTAEPPPEEAVEPEEVAEAEPVEASEAEPVEISEIDPIELGSSAESELSVAAIEPSPVVEAVEPETPEASEPVQAEAPAPSIEPEETMAMVAMPTPRSDRPPDQPRQPPPERRPEPEPQPRPSTPPPGNNGNSAADSAASGGGAPPQQSNVGSGGDAEVARYPSQVIGKLRAAMRRGGDSGEVVVRFTLSSGGQLAGVSVARSSGNPAVDAAGTELVQRAAPYPPIPAGAGRDSWTFDVPLSFGGSR